MTGNSAQDTFSLQELRTLNKTISNIYARASNGQILRSLSDFSTDFLHDLSNQVHFDKSNIMFYAHNPQVNAYEVSSFFQIGWQEDDLAGYVNQYCHIDDVLPILSAECEIAFMNGNIFSFREQTQYYKEFVAPAQIVTSLDANILLPKTCAVNAIIGVFRNEGKSGFSQKDLEIVKIFQPHLSNTLSQYFEYKQNVADDLIETFSKIETICVCVLNEDLKLMAYNSAFQAHIASSESEASESLVDSELFKKIQEICANLKNTCLKDSSEKYGPIAVKSGTQTYPMEIVYSKRESGAGKFACLLFTDNFSLKLKKVQSSHNLSNRECEILNLLLKRGLTNEEISACLYISSSTVKKHLTSAYRKIGVSNQKQLQTLFRNI